MVVLLKKGGGKGISRFVVIIVNFSVWVGFIGDNGIGGWYVYCVLKFVLN